MESLHSLVNEYDFSKVPHSLETIAPSVTCHVITPASFKGIIFVGLFPRPIPDQVPIVGYALNHRRTSCIFQGVPKGEYYVPVAAVESSLNPTHYFLLDKALRGKSEEAIKLDESTTEYVEVLLREPLPFDPPILINLPKLLFDTEKRKQEEK